MPSHFQELLFYYYANLLRTLRVPSPTGVYLYDITLCVYVTKHQ